MQCSRRKVCVLRGAPWGLFQWLTVWTASAELCGRMFRVVYGTDCIYMYTCISQVNGRTPVTTSTMMEFTCALSFVHSCWGWSGLTQPYGPCVYWVCQPTWVNCLMPAVLPLPAVYGAWWHIHHRYSRAGRRRWCGMPSMRVGAMQHLDAGCLEWEWSLRSQWYLADALRYGVRLLRHTQRAECRLSVCLSVCRSSRGAQQLSAICSASCRRSWLM